MQKWLLLLGWIVVLSSPMAAQAANAQANEYDQLGMALYQQGLFDKSISYFQTAVQSDPSDWQGYEDMGNAYMKINDNTDALNAYQKSLQINPNNSQLQTTVQNLQSSSTASNSTNENTSSDTNDQQTSMNAPPPRNVPPAQPPSGVNNTPSDQNYPPSYIIVRRRHHPWGMYDYSPQPEPVYKDGLAPINHSRMWLTTELGYNWANLPDFFDGAANENSYIQQNGYTGIATADHSGLEGGVELGFMLNPYNGIALGIRGIATNPYNSNINFENGNDFETVSIQPYVFPLTADYYLFLPDHTGRFFLTAGVGYYYTDVNVNDNYSYTVSNPTIPNDQLIGDLYGGNIGFQLGIGRDFEISPHLGLRIFARGRYCKITNINGYFTSVNGAYGDYGLMVAPYVGQGLAVDSTSNIGYKGEHYATLDCSGFDIGVGLTFF